jgi:Ca2+-binding RTX toxin-like protein
MATVYGDNSSNIVNWQATHGNDFIYLFGGNDTVWAKGGNDEIYGGTGNDTLYGNDGDDLIVGGEGADEIVGGDGTDTASYLDSTTGVTVSLADGTGFGGTAEGDTLASVENLTGSHHNDALIGDDGNNVLTGGYGDDTLKGGGGADRLNGGADNDTLKGGAGADTLNGGAGIDTASYTESDVGVTVSLLWNVGNYGDAEGDSLYGVENLTGSAYQDTLNGDHHVNVLRGMNGDDTLKGYGGDDTLVGGDGDDFLFGMDDRDTLRGDAGHDVLDGGLGADTLIGGIGSDTYFVDAGDTVTELAGQGFDTVVTALGSYTLGVAVENLAFQNVAGAGVYGYGNTLGNTITGNDLSNLLDGGVGADILTGGGGVDNFVFRAGQANGDRITDFTGSGALTGDSLIFVGYGTIAQGATFHQLTATTWEIGSADGTIHDIITVNGAIDASDFAFALA